MSYRFLLLTALAAAPSLSISLAQETRSEVEAAAPEASNPAQRYAEQLISSGLFEELEPELRRRNGDSLDKKAAASALVELLQAHFSSDELLALASRSDSPEAERAEKKLPAFIEHFAFVLRTKARPSPLSTQTPTFDEGLSIADSPEVRRRAARLFAEIYPASEFLDRLRSYGSQLPEDLKRKFLVAIERVPLETVQAKMHEILEREFTAEELFALCALFTTAPDEKDSFRVEASPITRRAKGKLGPRYLVELNAYIKDLVDKELKTLLMEKPS